MTASFISTWLPYPLKYFSGNPCQPLLRFSVYNMSKAVGLLNCSGLQNPLIAFSWSRRAHRRAESNNSVYSLQGGNVCQGCTPDCMLYRHGSVKKQFTGI